MPTFSRGSPAGTPTTGQAIAPGMSDEQALYRNYRSPQVLRAGMVESGGSSITSSSPAPSLPLQPQLRQSAIASPVPSVASTTNTGPIPSPPPPYSRAITEVKVRDVFLNQYKYKPSFSLLHPSLHFSKFKISFYRHMLVHHHTIKLSLRWTRSTWSTTPKESIQKFSWMEIIGTIFLIVVRAWTQEITWRAQFPQPPEVLH